jgi:thiamine-monophosphate kinase
VFHHTLSEDELVRIIQRTAKSRGRVRLGIGDDAAVLKDGTVVTTDAYAEGVHFDLSYMTLRQVGERCACGAISDVVAMGAEPEAVFVAMALPAKRGRGSGIGGRGTADDFRFQIADCRTHNGRGKPSAVSHEPLAIAVRELYRGIESVCAEMGCEVAGGDTIVTDQLLLALTVTGKTRIPRLRSGARPGDRLYVTGHLGSAEAGRMLLADEVRSQGLESRRQSDEKRPAGSCVLFARGDWRLPLVSRHLRPVPRLAVTRVLKSRIHGLIDTSDGLATDARHLSDMSGVRILLDGDALPVLPATRTFCAGRGFDSLGFVLEAGEDYELLFTSRGPVPSSIKGVNITGIGRVENGCGLWIENAGRTLPVTATGYDHLKVDRCGKTC